MLKNWGYLCTYAFTFFINGLIGGTIGPLIPFLAANSHRSQSDYSFLFICRSVGALLGGILYKILQRYELTSTHHKIIAILALVYSAGLLCFSISNSRMVQGLLLVLYAGITYIHCLSLNFSVMMVALKQNLFFWLSCCHGSYGLGALSAPLVVNLLITKAFIVPAVFLLIVASLYFFVLLDPRIKQQQKRQIQQQQLEPQEKKEGNSNHQPKQVSTFTMIFLALNYFLLHGIENVNGGWISSYATMTNIASKQKAGLFATYFWLTYTIARLVSGCINLKVMTKLKRLTEIGVSSAIVCFVLSISHYKHLGTILCSVFQGIGVSGIFPLTLSLPYEFNLYISEANLSTIMLFMMLSEGIMVFPVGLLMKQISVEVFFISLIIFNSIMLINSRWIMCRLQEQASKQELSEEVKMNYYKFLQIQEA